MNKMYDDNGISFTFDLLRLENTSSLYAVITAKKIF